VKWVTDATGRFKERPHYTPAELDAECEDLVSGFLSANRGPVVYPIATNDLVVLLESLSADLDVFADLEHEGEGVEGVTYFDAGGGRPTVCIASYLAEDRRRENRYRTTLAHELGHVRLHSFLWRLDRQDKPFSPRCRRQTIVRAPQADWMEWQAAYAGGAILMPRAVLEGIVRDFRAAHPDLEGPLLREVQTRFGVSAEAARVRLLQTGLLERSTRIFAVSRQPGWFRMGRKARAGS
jgi:hypothetical protein